MAPSGVVDEQQLPPSACRRPVIPRYIQMGDASVLGEREEEGDDGGEDDGGAC